MTRALFLSPHLDDGAFSAPEPMLTLVEAGWDVTLATVFTASVAHPSGFALACQLDKGLAPDVDYMALRRAEDIAFCRALGITPRHLDFAEAPHRGYDNVAALFGDRHADDPAGPAVAGTVSELLAAEAPTLCFAPIGIGHHVDHQIVVEALAGLSPAPLRYADQPYTLKQPESADSVLAAWAPAACFTFASHAGRRQRAVAAVAAYESQIGFQFGDVSTMRNTLADAFAAGTPFWQPAGDLSNDTARRLAPFLLST